MGAKTKEMIHRLRPESIPIIDHENLDRVTAEALVNAAGSTTGDYPNLGPFVLARAGVYILDGVGTEDLGMRSSSAATSFTGAASSWPSVSTWTWRP